MWIYKPHLGVYEHEEYRGYKIRISEPFKENDGWRLAGAVKPEQPAPMLCGWVPMDRIEDPALVDEIKAWVDAHLKASEAA